MVESRKREQISEKRNKRGEGKELKEGQKYAGGKLRKKRLKTSRKRDYAEDVLSSFLWCFLSNEAVN